MKPEKPIRIERNKWSGKHPTETRVFAREIHENFCAKKGCKFYGKHSQQGVCHTTHSNLGDGGGWGHIERAERIAEEALKWMRQRRKKWGTNAYIKYLESCYVCQEMNMQFILDEMIHTRRKFGLLSVARKKRKASA
jgi:hypothetical protein